MADPDRIGVWRLSLGGLDHLAGEVGEKQQMPKITIYTDRDFYFSLANPARL
jgi:hypothetical protein